MQGPLLAMCNGRFYQTSRPGIGACKYIIKILLLFYHDQGLSLLLGGSGEAWIRVQRVSQGLAMHAGPRGRRAGRGVTGDDDANQQIASPYGGSVHGIRFPGPSVKGSDPMRQPVD